MDREIMGSGHSLDDRGRISGAVWRLGGLETTTKSHERRMDRLEQRMIPVDSSLRSLEWRVRDLEFQRELLGKRFDRLSERVERTADAQRFQKVLGLDGPEILWVGAIGWWLGVMTVLLLMRLRGAT